MANFLVIVDPDRDRRIAFCKAARPQLAFIGNLTSGECSSGDFQALWASGARAPVGSTSDDATAAIIWGRPIRADGRRVEAHDLVSEWSGRRDAPPPIFD